MDRDADISAVALNDLPAAKALARGRFWDPFAYLGPHETENGPVVRADEVEVLARQDDTLLGRCADR
jgi:hypothetical protein